MVLEKAYDRVDWDFLMYMLYRMGFGVRCILECISSACFFVLINGAANFSFFFWAKRGLRKGHLLSPFLFVIVG